MRRDYRIICKKDSRQLTEFFAENGQAFWPMVELIQIARLAADEVVERIGKATLEAIVLISD